MNSSRTRSAVSSFALRRALPFSLAATLLIAGALRAADSGTATATGGNSAAAAAASDADAAAQKKAASDKAQDDRVAKWVDALKLDDATKSARVIAIVSAHRKTIRDWHNEHPASSVPAGINPVTGQRLNELDRQMIATSSISPSVRKEFLAALRTELTEAQVESILDGITIGKVAFTLNGYKAIVPDLTAEEEKTILGFLKQAREESIDYKNANQISVIFEIYKTKSEQYLNSNGRSWKALYKSYTDGVKAKKAADAAAKVKQP